MSYWTPVYRGLLAAGADVFALDYRGFGRSEGRPDEAGVYQDAAAAWAWLTGQRGFAADRILIYGFSLGGGVATWLTTEHQPAGLVLQSTFTSIPDMAAKIFPPARWLVRTIMDSLSRIGRIKCPIFVIHGSGDELVPFELGQRLHAAALPGTRFQEVPGSGHNETFEDGGASLVKALKEFFEACTRSSALPPIGSA